MNIEARPSIIYFIYPFLFDPNQYIHLIHKANAAEWRVDGAENLPPARQYKKLWRPDDNLSAKGIELLPHVANFLNPKDDSTTATAYSWEFNHDALVSPTYGLGAGGDIKSSRISWYLAARKRDPIRFVMPNIRLSLFHIGVGFLIIEAEPVSEEHLVPTWLDFLHYFRFADGQRDVYIRATERLSNPEDGELPYFPRPAGGIDPKSKDKKCVFDIIRAVLDTLDTHTHWYKDVFIPGQLLTFTSLFINGVATEAVPELIYRIRNLFYSNQPIDPDAKDLSLDHEAILPYARDKRFLFSLDGGAFVSINQPPGNIFFDNILPGLLKNTYLLLYMMTLEQRFGLMMLSKEVAEKWLTNGQLAEPEREKAFAWIRDNLLSFTARSYFAQVVQRDHPHCYYQKWQDIFQVDRLFSEVSSEVNEMHQYLESKRTARLQQLSEDQEQKMEAESRRSQRVERFITYGGAIIGWIALTLTFVQAAGEKWQSPENAWLAVAVGTMLTIVTMGGIYYSQRRIQK